MILLCLILARPISATLTNFAKYLTKKLETVLRSNLNSPCQDGTSSGCGEVPPDDDRSTAAEEKGGKRPSQFHPASNHTPLPFLSTSCQATLFMRNIFRPPLFFMRHICRARRCPWVTTRGSSRGTWTTTTQVRGPVLGPTFADLGQLSGIERARRGGEVQLNSIELELKTDSELKTRRWRCGR